MSYYIESLVNMTCIIFSCTALLDVIHAVAKYDVGHESREIFFFREGSIVMWNISDLECGNVLQFLKRYEHKRYTEELVHSESEFMNYAYADPGYLFSFIIGSIYAYVLTVSRQIKSE